MGQLPTHFLRLCFKLQQFNYQVFKISQLVSFPTDHLLLLYSKCHLLFNCDFVSLVTEHFQDIKITLPLFNVSVMQCYYTGNYLRRVFIYVSLLLGPLWRWMEVISVCLVWGTSLKLQYDCFRYRPVYDSLCRFNEWWQ